MIYFDSVLITRRNFHTFRKSFFPSKLSHLLSWEVAKTLSFFSTSKNTSIAASDGSGTQNQIFGYPELAEKWVLGQLNKVYLDLQI